MKQPLVSIITVTYNSDKTLERTILSVIGQSFPDIEYIIIDGGSIDGTIDIIKKYESNISFWISEKDNGIYDAMNKGIRQAKGELIGTLNSDDWLNSDAIKIIVDSYLKFGFDVFAGAVQLWSGDIKDIIVYSNTKNLTSYMSINHPSTYITRSTYIKFGLYSLKYKIASDYDLILRVFLQNARYFISQETISNMSLGGISDSSWKIGLRESRNIKIVYLRNNLISYFDYFFLYYKDYLVRRIKASFFRKIYDFYKRQVSFFSKGYAFPDK